MPTYDFACNNKKCKHEFEAYIPKVGGGTDCQKCGGATEKVWAITKRSGYMSFPFTTSHITGKSIEIRSQSHLDKLCKKHNVSPRDDAAWLTKEYRGVDWNTGAQIYHEASGVGLPGCWV